MYCVSNAVSGNHDIRKEDEIKLPMKNGEMLASRTFHRISLYI